YRALHRPRGRLMVRRVVLGARPSGIGIFVSRPGVDALTATGDNLLLSSDARQMQIVQSGAYNASFVMGISTQTIHWGPLGYRPLILLVGQHTARFVYNNDNSATVTIGTRQSDLDVYWTTANKPALSSRIEWFAMRPGI